MRHRGFSLIELIVVILILGIIGAGTAIYIVRGMQAYTDSVRRDRLAATARAATERVVRELRNALPNSIRISTGSAAGVTTACIEFVPVERASAYRNALAPQGSITRFDAVPFAPPTAGNRFVVIYPYAMPPLYAGGNPGPVAGFDATSNTLAGEVRLAAAHRFAHDSPQRRFFVTTAPVSFCIDDGTGQLNRYGGYGFSAAPSAPPAATPALLGEHLQLLDGGAAVTPFAWNPGSLTRAGVVTLDFRFMEEGEWVRLRQEVQIRNAP